MRARAVLTVCTATLWYVGCAAVPAPAAKTFATAPASFHEPARLAIVGDMRDDRTFLGIGSNEDECRSVVNAIVADRPSLVVITGDLVFEASKRDWLRFDDLTSPLRDNAIPVVAVMGNHEYRGSRVDAEGQFFARFPALDRHLWHTMDFGPTRMVFIDTTAEKLTAAEWAEQRAWFERTLDDADRDDAVRGLIVLAHHPPYTNSVDADDGAAVRAAFVPAFMRSRKTLAYLAGHVHNYERFARGGKTFVVSGGGGAEPARVALGAARRHPDDLFAGPALRPFHFIMYELGPTGLTAEVRAVPTGQPRRVIDRFDLRYP